MQALLPGLFFQALSRSTCCCDIPVVCINTIKPVHGMQDQASAEASAQKVAAELLAEVEQAAVRAAAKKAKKLRQKQAKKLQPQAVKAHSGPAEHSVPRDVPAHNVDESEPLKGDGHADHTDSAPSAAEQNCSEPALQDSPSSQSAPVSKACLIEEPRECSSTTSAHSEAHVIDGAEASCDTTAAPAAALSACSLAQSLEAGLAPSGSSAAKASDVESSAQHADAIFLKNLFCCPITQVSHPPSCSHPCTTGTFTDARSCTNRCHVGCHQHAGTVILQSLCTPWCSSYTNAASIASLHQL
jgi:hypothetical protein